MANDVTCLKGMINNDMDLNSAIKQLQSMFPNVANVLAWREAVFMAQTKYSHEEPMLADHQLYVAKRWIELADSGRLSVNMDQYRGLIVEETAGSASTQRAPSRDMIRTFLREMLFNLLSALPQGRNLPIFEIQAAFQNTARSSLADHWEEFAAVVDELSDKYYITYTKVKHSGGLIFFKGIAFNTWGNEMTNKVPMNNTYHFNAPVGAVQTGDHSVAHIQQATDQSQLAELKSALEAVLAGLAKADLTVDAREDVEGLVQNTIAEVEKDKPNKPSLKAMLSTVATTIQTLGSTAEAYTTLKAAALVIGITLP